MEIGRPVFGGREVMRMDRKHTPGAVMCSEIVSLHLQSREGRERELKVNLEEIWSSGALFRADLSIRPFTSLWFAGEGCEFRGQVIARTSVTGLGAFIEMRFHPSCLWSEQKYRPKHLFNPVVLLARRRCTHQLACPMASRRRHSPGQSLWMHSSKPGQPF
jgi:hypothetical protein